MTVNRLKLVIGASAFAMLGGCAFGYSEPLKDPQQIAFVKTVCERVMGVRTNDEMLACTNSLSDSLVAQSQARIDRRSDQDCSERGLRNGTSSYSLCVLDRQRFYTAQPTGAAFPEGTTNVASVKLAYDDAGTSGNHNDWTFDGRHRREELSCAQLGLDPTSRPFVECVTGLEYALWTADTPMN